MLKLSDKPTNQFNATCIKQLALCQRWKLLIYSCITLLNDFLLQISATAQATA